MSDVTTAEIIGAVAATYKLPADVLDGTYSPQGDEARRRHMQGRLVAMYLLSRHRGLNKAQICDALGLPVNGTAYDHVKMALGLVPIYAGYDLAFAARLERCEEQIDKHHERRLTQRGVPRGPVDIERRGIAA